MTQKTSPFVEAKYGWDLGESGWNGGMDENLTKFSFLFDSNIDGIVSSLPAPVDGKAYFLTTDNRVYYSVGGSYTSTPVPLRFTLSRKSDGALFQFNGVNLEQVLSQTDVKTAVEDINTLLPTLATKTEVSLVESNSNGYTDSRFTSLAGSSGSDSVGYGVYTVSDRLGQYKLVSDYPDKETALDQALYLEFTAGVYDFSTPIPLKSGQTIKLNAGAVLRNLNTGDTGIFSIAAGVSNVSIYGPGELIGPYTSTTPAPSPVYPGGNGALRITGLYNNQCSNIKVEGVTIRGWGDYGIFAENVLGSSFNLNNISRCGRDGIRFYGAVYTTACLNHIDNISPGFAGSAPNLNVYGITFTRRPTAGTNLTTNPPSKYCIAANNVITNCTTWKGLDTHGGQDLLFSGNIITNCHIGIGIDEGDTTGATDAPPIRIKVVGNNITRGSGNAGGAGINISSSSTANMGQDNELSSNTIVGHGGVSTGGINVAYQDRLQINNNQLIDCEVSGINIPGGVRVTAFRYSGNTIKNTLGTSLAAISVQAAEVSGCVQGLTLVRTNGTMTGFSLANPSSGYGIQIGGEITQTGTITLFGAGSLARVVGGSLITSPLAYGRIAADGTLSSQYGIASSSKVSTGVYDVVLTYTGQSTSSLNPTANRRATTAGLIAAIPTSTNTIRVSTFNASGVATDAEFSILVNGI